MVIMILIQLLLLIIVLEIFAKLLDDNYKANRKGSELPNILKQLHNYVTDKYDGVKTCGVETDDLVARYWKHLTQKKVEIM